MAKLVPCVGCGALVPDIGGPTHRYIGASPGCWQAYGELLPTGTAHLLVVDVYAAQHPGVLCGIDIHYEQVRRTGRQQFAVGLPAARRRADISVRRPAYIRD